MGEAQLVELGGPRRLELRREQVGLVQEHDRSFAPSVELGDEALEIFA